MPESFTQSWSPSDERSERCAEKWGLARNLHTIVSICYSHEEREKKNASLGSQHQIDRVSDAAMRKEMLILWKMRE